jgi:hypothetical protein
VLAVLNTVGEV